MTTKQFIQKVQNYYGVKYREGEHIDMVFKYLNSKTENYLTCLYPATLKGFSGQFKTLPDIKIFEDLIEETYKIMDEVERKQQIQDLQTPAITDGEEVDYTDEMKDLFDGMDKRFKK